jgi:FkbM family methyltransferase
MVGRRALALLPPRARGRARTLSQRVRRARFRPRVVEHTYGGHRLRVEIHSGYGAMYDEDWPALPELEVLRRHRLKPGARVFNLGANHGVIALMLARIVGPEGHVVALEANPYDARAAARNAELNEAEQLTCISAAVAEASGELTFALGGEVADGSGAMGGVRVPALSIDDLAAEHGPPDVVFMDVEGYELKALAGAEETLTRRPDWFVEVHGNEEIGRYGGTVDDVLEVFASRGYDCLVAADRLGHLADGRHVSLTRFRPLGEAAGVRAEGRFFLIATAAGAEGR